MGVWQYIFVGLGILLLAVSSWQQYKRGNKKNLALRLFACLIAIASLTCLGVNITYKKNTAANGAAIITTSGYSEDSIHAFEQAENKIYTTYTFNEFLTNDTNSYKILHVFGYGLSDDELLQLQNIPVIFHPQSISNGIVSADWPQTIQAGEKLLVQGTYKNTGNTPVILQLNGLNTLFDSITIPANSNQNFELSTTPRQQGKALYAITALSNNKVIEEEPLPFEVQPNDTLNVLMLASSPSFENKFLKNWLADNAYHVSLRSTTSKEKFNNSFINTPSSSIEHITTNTLNKYDVLVCDATGFAQLNKDEQYAMQSSIENGMGLVVSADTTLPQSFFSSSFSVYSGTVKPQALHINADGGILKPLPIQQPLYIRSQAGIQAAATDSAQQLFAGVTLYGAGKVAVTTLNNTYNWMLNGDKESYAAYWSNLLSKVATDKSNKLTVTSSPWLPLLNQPLHITVQGNTNKPLAINNTPVYLAQSTILPYEWSGIYWPVQTGWHTLKQGNDSINFYVYTGNDWQYVQASQKMSATQQYVAVHKPTSNYSSTVAVNVPVNKLYFVIIFLFACTFLWIERKFNG